MHDTGIGGLHSLAGQRKEAREVVWARPWISTRLVWWAKEYHTHLYPFIQLAPVVGLLGPPPRLGPVLREVP